MKSLYSLPLLCISLLLTSVEVLSQSSAEAINTEILINEIDLIESEAAYEEILAPIEKSLNLNTRLFKEAQARKRAADAALAKKGKGKNWAQKLIDDEETDRLQIEQGAAEMAMSAYGRKIQRLEGQIKTLRNEQRILEDRLKLNIKKADETTRAAEQRRREQEVEDLNTEFFTARAKRVATERVFDEKLAVLNKLIDETAAQGLDEGVAALEKDRETLTLVRDQWLTGIETEIKSAARSLNATYRKNANDEIGPTHSDIEIETKADEAAYVDSSRIALSVQRSKNVAGNALANTRHDITLATTLEDYGNTALRDEKTGEWEIGKFPIKSVDWEKGEVEWTGVAERYGYYWKGAGIGAKNIVVDLLTLLAVGTETLAQATEVAANSVRDKDNQTNLTGTDKIDAVYTGGNFLAEAAAGDRKTAARRREQMATAAERGGSAVLRKVEQTAGKGKQGYNEATQFAGQVATEALADLWLGGSKASKLDDVADAGKLSKADGDAILARINADDLAKRTRVSNQTAEEFAEGLKRTGLEPKRTLEVRGKKYHVSEPFESQGRTMVIALEEGADGSMIPRTFALSGEHGVWRAVPAKSMGDGVLNKGPRSADGGFINEGAVDLDAALQSKLDSLTNEFEVRKLDGDDEITIGQAAIDIADPNRLGAPDSLGADAADLARDLPGVKPGDPTPVAGKAAVPEQLPEGMRPDWADGMVSQSTIDHSLYGKLERFVYKSLDGKTDWIINRAENGDVWVASMQDATAEISALGTRTKAWQTSGITAQPLTKGDGVYVPAEGWRNPFNEYMADHLPNAPEASSKAPDGSPLVSPDGGRPRTGTGSRQAAKAGDGPSERDIAIASSAMVPEHAEAFVKIAQERGEIIMIRPVNPDSTAKIASDAATKGMNIKGKSTDWGPKEVKGLIPTDASYSKLGNPDAKVKASPKDIKKYSELNKKALGEPWEEYVDGKWVRRDPVEPIAMRKKLFDKDGNPVLAEDGTHLEVLAERKLVVGKDGKPLLDANGNRQYEAGNPITADYDLFAVGIRGERGRLIENDPEMGTIAENEVATMKALNDAVRETGYKGGKVVHHGPANRFANEFEAADFPIGVALPNGDFMVLRSASDVRKFYERMARAGYNMDAMPGWDFGIIDPAERVAKARAGDAKRAAQETDKAPLPDQGSKRPGTLAPRVVTGAASNAQEQKDKKEKADREKFIISLGETPLSIVVDPIYFSFYRRNFDGGIEGREPDDSTYIALGNDVGFELESAISLDGTNTHSQLALAAEFLLSEERAKAPPAAPPQKQAPPPPPPLQKPPEVLIGQPEPPIQEETEPPEAPLEEKTSPPPPAEPKKDKKKIGIGTGTGGVTHFSSYSVACFGLRLVGDLAYVDEAQVEVSGPGGSQLYDLRVNGSEIRLEHEIYSYGSYAYALENATDKDGEAMTITGDPRGSYEVTAEDKPCW
ncbi:anthrax toxin-like adenylyl cyclase domain-containing protein [Congregibacter litoralis]|nr:anthrax toxin-like adenylyl cyclase domain-containing protein [Congregibacter litoralis]